MAFKPLLIAVILIGLLALGLGSATAQSPTPQLPVNAEGVALVAIVNEVEITLPEYLRALARRQVEVLAADPATLAADVLEQLIDQELIEQGAAAQDIAITDEEVQAELQINLELAGSEDAWNEWLTINNFTPEEFLQTLRDTLLTNKVRDWLTADLGGDVPQVHARHILVQTEADAQNVAARLKAGEDFGLVAQQMSLDETTRGLGGDLGWFAHDELLAPELEALAFALQPGQIGGPVSSVLGYHLVQTLEVGARPVDPERRVYISQNRFENWLDQLRQTAVIERYL